MNRGRTIPASPIDPAPVNAAHLFAALGDQTRLTIVENLCNHGPQSITALTTHALITRQAITKHLHVLEAAGIATSRQRGRERIWRLRPARLASAHDYLDLISQRWDDAISRLEAHLKDMP